MTMDVSFVGLGTMGRAMARRLLDTGHQVRVWNRSSAATETLTGSGAQPVASVEEAFQSGIVHSMLADDYAVEDCFKAAVLAGAPAGSVHVNHASVSVAAVERLTALHAEAGVGYVAAPVLGRPSVAAAGRLAILAGGATDQIARVQPLLDALGERTWVVGTRPSAANLAKIGVNYNLIHSLQALAESISLVERAGVDPSLFVDILTHSLYTGAVYQGYGAQIAERRYTPTAFRVELGLKDLTLAQESACAFGSALPTAPVLRTIFEQTLADPSLTSLDWAAMAEITRRASYQHGQTGRCTALPTSRKRP
jgi:3-hydroxyisobutyrate dehydrogenase-like beta-hydroxyacid dehydrogenase